MFVQKYTPLIARAFLAVIFIQTGIAKMTDFTGTQEQIASIGIPLAGLVALFSIVFEIMGGVSLVVGYKAKIGAVLLLLFLVPATLVFHNPIVDPSQTIQFMKNLAIVGGLLMVFAFGAGPVSLDHRIVSASQSYQS